MQKKVNFRTESETIRLLGGFTLIELLVALVAASVVSLAALQVYGAYHKLYRHLYGDYQKETAAILEELRRINPYCFGASLRR